VIVADVSSATSALKICECVVCESGALYAQESLRAGRVRGKWAICSRAGLLTQEAFLDLSRLAERRCLA